MSFQVSPGIEINEVDQTNIVPAVATSVGAYAGHFNWGPVDEVVTVGSEKELADSFGTPTRGTNARSFLTAASFLKYSNSLRVARAIGAGALNSANASPVLIKNKEAFDTLTGLNFIFAARCPGALGDSIQVSLAYVNTDGDGSFNTWAYRSLFSVAPNRSPVAIANGLTTNDEIHVVVIDALGLITGTKGTVLEKYEGLSLGSNARTEDGGSLYYKDVINNSSSYIYVNSLSSIFNGADMEISEDTPEQFSVIGSAVNQISSLVLPFNQVVETSVTYGDAAPIVTTTITSTSLQVLSGIEGQIGNNAKVNVRLVGAADTPATKAHGFISYGVPVIGDTVSVNGTTYTLAAALDVGANEFSTISELVDLLVLDSDIVSVVVGNTVLIEAGVAGAAGNAIALELGASNTGTMGISGATLTNGNDVNTANYLSLTIDDLAPLTGYVTYDITVGATSVGSNRTNVSLADILTELAFQYVSLNNADVPKLAFLHNGVAVTVNDTLAQAVLNVESLLPLAGGEVLAVIPFAGGEVAAFSNQTLIASYSLTGGANGSVVPGNVSVALDHFADADTISIDFLFGESFEDGSQETIDTKLYTIANGRKDILSMISAPLSIATLSSNILKKQAVIAKFDSTPYTSSSYVVFDQTPVYTYNKYADNYVWIPAAGHMAGLCANADLVSDPWFSPAGFNRGQLKGVIKIAFNPTRTDRDDLYSKRINSIVSMPGQGVVLYGDKTALSKPSAFDRINVRRLFNVLERAISNAARFQLFELNDEFTRVSFKNTIEPFLRDVQGRRGITEFLVVCDETNNTAEVIDRNEFVGDIYIKPTSSINNIKLNFISTRTGVDFREIVGA